MSDTKISYTDDKVAESFEFRRDMWNHPTAYINIYERVADTILDTCKRIVAANPTRDFVSKPIRIADIGGYDGQFAERVLSLCIESNLEADVSIDVIDPATAGEDGEDQGLNFFSSMMTDHARNASGEYDIVNMMNVIYHLPDNETIVNDVDSLLRNEPATYMIVTNIGDQYMAPITNENAVREFSYLSNDLMAHVLVGDDKQRFNVAASISYKTEAQLGETMIREYANSNSMFKDSSTTAYLNDNWESIAEAGIVLFDFRTDIYGRATS